VHRHRHEVGAADELGRWSFRRGDREEDVRPAALGDGPRRASRYSRHRRRARVDADDEVSWIRPRSPDGRTAVTGPEVDDESLESGETLIELADVYVAEPASSHDAHRRTLHFGS
jgi:hypothetical protein